MKFISYIIFSLLLTACGSSDSTKEQKPDPKILSITLTQSQQVDEKTPVSLSATVSDSNMVSAVRWKQTSGEKVNLTTSENLAASFIAPTVLIQEGPKTLEFQLEVTDTAGNIKTANTTIVITAVNLPPTIEILNSDTVMQSQTANLTIKANDSDGTVESLLWTQISGPTVDLTSTKSASTSFNTNELTVGDELVFGVTATDNETQSLVQQIKITILEYRYFQASNENILAMHMATNKTIKKSKNNHTNTSLTENILAEKPTTLGTYFLANDDIDNDGFEDVMVASRFDRKLHWLKNDGSGNFEAKFILDLPTNNPNKLKLINLNNDDLPDVAIEFFTGYCQLDIITYTNLGNGKFSNPQALKNDCTSMEFKDINNDGFIDYIFQESGNLYWYKNTQGQFASEPSFLLDSKPYLLPESGPNKWRYNLAATDINNDNKTDIIVARVSGMYLFIQGDNLSFNEGIKINDFGINTNVSYFTLHALDINLDNHIDLISHAYDSQVNIMFGDGTGQFTLAPRFELLTNNAKSQLINYDDDNVPDLLIVDRNQISVMQLGKENHPITILSTPERKTIGQNREYRDLIFDGVLIDINNNGKLSLIRSDESNYKAHNIGMYSLNSNNEYKFSQTLVPTGNVINGVAYGDIDNDNDNDLIVSFLTNKPVIWYENLGNAQFSEEKVLFNTLVTVGDMQVFDMNNDDKNDIITDIKQSSLGNFAHANEFGIFYADNNNAFHDITYPSPYSSYSEYYNWSNIILGDFNNNNKLDIIYGSNWGINLLQNDESNSFSLLTRHISDIDFKTLTKTDINEDGIIDIIASHRNDGIHNGHIIAYINDGTGLIANEKNIVEDIQEVSLLKTSDFNNDGKLDLLVGFNDWFDPDSSNGYGATGVLWLSDINSNSPIRTVIRQGGDIPNDIAIGDVDGDGDQDLVMAFDRADKVKLYLNDGQGNFNDTQTIIDKADYAFKVFLDDLDKDGDLEVLSISINDGKVSWVENTFTNKK